MPIRTQVYPRPQLELIYTIHHEISEFTGTEAVIDWAKKLELVCDLCGVKQLVWVIPLHLTRGVFAVYQQLTKDKKSRRH